MTTATSTYRSGWCSSGYHHRCSGAYAGVTCSCQHHEPTEPEPVPAEPPTPTHSCPTCRCEEAMPTTTATPTVDELQKKIVKLQRQNDELVDAKLELEGHVDELQEQLREGQDGDELRADRARQVIVNHHDDAGHRGSQRFCTEAPCPALNALLDGGAL